MDLIRCIKDLQFVLLNSSDFSNFDWLSGKEVVVFLPDHGFFCAVKIRQMWDLESKFGKLPFQAFVASLPIISPGLTERWSPEAVQVFKVFVCCVISC